MANGRFVQMMDWFKGRVWSRGLLAVVIGALLPLALLVWFISWRTANVAQGVSARSEVVMPVLPGWSGDSLESAPMMAPPVSSRERGGSPVLGLVAIMLLGGGLVATDGFKKHKGLAMISLFSLLFGIGVAFQAANEGSFGAIVDMVGLKPRELADLPVGHIGLTIMALVLGFKGALRVPDALEWAMNFVDRSLKALLSGLKALVFAYSRACWFLACKAVGE